ncbi:hypothetical protein PVAND_011382 [Polypedilum vanderplanki]|uniref:Uncharacterized protein n=1 Tax=Polypedilum vanderplanki TaxID=319348 RepID=A0A9J6CJD6_POLVA|nr:hypothetical protein PVAND_011382 [Polypedilum vanderplanki]
MSSNNDKRRTSILKKRKSVDDETMEVTVNKIQKKTQFSQKNQVKEFRECSERLTIWGNSYETLDVSKFDTGSYDSNHKSNNDIIQNSKSSQNESEKENIIIHSDVSSRLEQNVSTNSSHNSVELTLFVDSNEEKRMKKYGTENLNITSLAFDTSSSSSKILSPRKMVFNNKSNVSVVIKDKVYIEPSAQENSVSFITEPNECPNSEHEASNKPYALKTNVNKLSITDSNFKPKTVSMPVNKKTHSLLIASPSNKPKDPNDDLFKLIVSDTPSKNLCCLGKSCTPTRSESKVIFTAQRSTSIARKSINLLEEFETIEKNKIEKFTSARKTIFHNDSIQTDKNFNQKIIFGKTHMHLQTDQDKIPSIKIECYDDNEKANDESSELTENNV